MQIPNREINGMAEVTGPHVSGRTRVAGLGRRSRQPERPSAAPCPQPRPRPTAQYRLVYGRGSPSAQVLQESSEMGQSAGPLTDGKLQPPRLSGAGGGRPVAKLSAAWVLILALSSGLPQGVATGPLSPGF